MRGDKEMQKLSKTILFASSIVVSAAMASYGQITGNLGSTSVSYGSALSVQTTPTGFGDSPGGADATGSEIDSAYGTIAGGNLYLFLAGNYENNGNHVNVFIATGAPGQSVLNIGGGPTESAMNGSTFSPGFQANFMYDANDYQGTVYSDQVLLPSGGPGVQSYEGAVPLTGGIGNGTLTDGIGLALVNTNGAGVTGSSVTGAGAVGVGMELSIPLSLLGVSSGPLLVLADINGGGDSYLSNQFAPGLPNGTANVGGGGPYSGPSSGAFNFGSTPGEFMVVVPEPSSISLVVVGLLGAIGMIRRRKA